MYCMELTYIVVLNFGSLGGNRNVFTRLRAREHFLKVLLRPSFVNEQQKS